MSPFREEVRRQLQLALPVIVLQLALAAMGVVDTAFLGRVSDVEMAAVALGHGYSFCIIGFGMGVLVALDPIVSQAYGARDRTAMARAMQRGVLLALALSVPVALATWPAPAVLAALGQPSSVVPIAGEYARVAIVGVPAFLLFVALRTPLQAMHVLRPVVLCALAVNVLNVFLDWVLVYGNLGFPALGAVGSGWGTVVSRWALALGTAWLAWPVLRDYLVPFERRVFALAPLGRTLRVGLPIGAHFVLEMGAFTAIAFLMGNIDETAVAGHQVALMYSALTFMVPLGVSMAASVRVGNEIGAGRPERARLAARVAFVGGAAFMALAALVFVAMPTTLARVFTDVPDVVALAATLLPLAAAFQVFDGTQVVASGILRGAGDTAVPAVAHFLGFWVVGIPCGWWFGVRQGLGPQAVWWALVGSLALATLWLGWRARVRLAGPLERLRVEDPEAAS